MRKESGGRSKTALVAGASSGIGYELTQLFARDGFDLVQERGSAMVTGSGEGDTTQRWRVRANDSFSLAFHRPGTYAYYRLEDPNRRARIIVAE